jgi:hypothetical protein
MKRTITKWLGIAAMAGAITFSVIQMRVPVVRADGCPSNPWLGECSSCTFLYYTDSEYNGQIYRTCVYSCACGGGSGGEFFEIQREYTY